MAVVRLDDGKVNVISHRVIELLHAALDAPLEEATAGGDHRARGQALGRVRPHRDDRGHRAHAAALVGAGGRLLMRIYGHPQPVVLGVTGHALAAGALLALSCDTRIGGDGPAKIGLNETAIGMGLPHYAVELAEARLAAAHLLRAAVQAEIYDATGRGRGRLPRPRRARRRRRGRSSLDEARRLGQLPGGAYRHTKLALHQPLIDRVLERLDDDMQTMTGPA